MTTKTNGLHPKRVRNFLCGSLLGLTLGSAGPLMAAEAPDPDPWEGFNRKVYAFNKFVDRYLLKPVAKVYDWVLPEPVDDAVSNVFDNLRETRNFLNNLLQFKLIEAGEDASRFVINTTVGVLGVFDVATRWGIDRNEEDFGQTLAVWGLESGPYLVLPLLGPSTIRDGIGRVPDAYSVPQFYIDHNRTRNSVYGTDTVDRRADFFETEEMIQGDEYLFIRDAYLQRREYLATDGALEDPFTADDLEDY